MSIAHWGGEFVCAPRFVSEKKKKTKENKNNDEGKNKKTKQQNVTFACWLLTLAIILGKPEAKIYMQTRQIFM